MKILYVVGFSNWWGNYPPDILDREEGKTVGGGEAGALQTAFQLAARGHDVTYLSCALPGKYKGVTFAPLDEFYEVHALGYPWDAICQWSMVLPPQTIGSDEATLVVQQLNDLAFRWGWWENTDVLVSPSWTHAKAMAHYIPAGVTLAQHAVGNGVDLSLFPWPPRLKPSERPMTVGWWSSPDRGLHHLLRAWPQVHARVPDARLRVYYQVRKYIDHASNWGGRSKLMGGLIERLLLQTEPIGVELVDQIPRRVLAKAQAETRVQAYPCDPEGFTEGFATSILEALAAGCLPITRPVDALPELWDGAVWWLTRHPLDDDFIDDLADKVVRGLTEWPETLTDPTPAVMRERAERWPWEAVGREMEVAILKAIDIRKRRSAAVAA